MKMTKQIFLEKKWELEKKVLRTITGIALFAVFVFVDDIADLFEDIIDGLGDLIYDNSGFGHNTANGIAVVFTIYITVVLIDRIVSKFLPFFFKKLSTRHASRKTKKAKVSE